MNSPTPLRSSCPRCAAPPEAGDRFCIHCGGSLMHGTGRARSSAPLSAAHQCPACRSEVRAEDRFCVHCGNPLVASASQPTREPAANRYAPVCERCRSTLLQGDRFCIACGASTGSASAAAANTGASLAREERESARRHSPVIASAAFMLVIAGGAGAVWMAGSGDPPDEPSTRTPSTSASPGTVDESPVVEDPAEGAGSAQPDGPDEMVIPDPQLVDVSTLVGGETEVVDLIYADLTGTPPAEIIVHSQVAHQAAAGYEFDLPVIEVFQWSSREWTKVFDSTSDALRADHPLTTGEYAVRVDALAAVKFDANLPFKLVLGLYTVPGATAGPFEVMVLSFEPDPHLRFFDSTERGGSLIVDGSTIVLEAGSYRHGHAGCCPAERRTAVIGAIDQGTIDILSEQFERTCTGSFAWEHTAPEWDQDELPIEVAQVRDAIAAAAHACDYDQLDELASYAHFYFDLEQDAPEFAHRSPAQYWRALEGSLWESSSIQGPLGYMIRTLALPHCLPEHAGEVPNYIWPSVGCTSDPNDPAWDELYPVFDDRLVDFMRYDVGRWSGPSLGISSDGTWVWYLDDGS